MSWQITPRVLTEALAAAGDAAKRAFDAMMGMKKIDCHRDQGRAPRLTLFGDEEPYSGHRRELRSGTEWLATRHRPGAGLRKGW